MQAALFAKIFCSTFTSKIVITKVHQLTLSICELSLQGICTSLSDLQSYNSTKRGRVITRTLQKHRKKIENSAERQRNNESNIGRQTKSHNSSEENVEQ